ncbi:MAG TPA: glycosyltransferase family 2 protein [Thermoleophilaceae bacterium]
MISILIPVRDGGADLTRCLDAIAAQQIDDDYEVLVIDSGSRDGTAARARKHGARVHEIGASQFHHGRTRNLAGSLARGDILVWTTHDAYPEDEHWLDRLTAPLRAREPGVGGVYGRQIAHDDASPPERYFLDFLYGSEARVQRAAGVDELTMETTLYSNANSAMPRELFERFPFADDVLIAEDQDWSRRVLLAGYSIRYEPRAAVCHSHPYTLFTAFRRFFESGVAGSRTFLAGGDTAKRTLRRKGLDYARGELRWLVRSGNARWIPYTCVYDGLKFVAIQLGARHERLPLWLKRRWTRYPEWFNGG